MRLDQLLLYPAVIACVREQKLAEDESPLKAILARVSIDIYEVSGVGNLEAVTPEEPLVYLHLTLISPFPLAFQRHLSLRARGLVIDHEKLAVWLDPNVIHRTGQKKIRRLVQVLDALEVLPPHIDLLVLEGDGVDSMRNHEGVRRLIGSMPVKLAFEKRVGCRIQREGRTFHPVDTETTVDVKASRAT